MSFRAGLPLAVIAGASLLLAPAARPDPVTAAPKMALPTNGQPPLLVPTDDEAAPAGQVAPAATTLPATPAQGIDLAQTQAPAPKGDTFGLKATLYITTARDSGKDSIGCRVIPLRTVAVDGVHVRRHTILYIKETVGMRMPDGTRHDGYWYATDVGSAITRGRIDLYTGYGVRSIQPYLNLNLKTLTVTRVGTFEGCPGPKGVLATVAHPGNVVHTVPAVATAAAPQPIPAAMTVAARQ